MGEHITGSYFDLGIFSSTMGESIAQRRAAKFGFNATGINSTVIFQAGTLLASPTARSPRLTIPHGISPTALLESPVMLHNFQAQSSPTIGTLPLSPLNVKDSIMHDGVDSIGGSSSCSDVGSSFTFRPHCVQASTNRESDNSSHHTATGFKFFVDDTQKESIETSDHSTVPDMHKDFTTAETFQAKVSMGSATQRQQPNNSHREDLTSDTTEVDQGGAYLPVDHSDDGFNWRKYGQKHGKGSEFPRCYYKCTNLSCQVKKKVERSRSGEITEITYRGSHDHPKPRLTRQIDVGEEGVCGARAEGLLFFRRIQSGSKEIICGSDLKEGGLELASSTFVESPELSSTVATSHDNDDGDCGDDDDMFTQGSMSLVDEDDEDELESKRRRMGSSLMETSLATRAAREHRVVVQIESDIDILDDGYRWRKYGQKAVKGNPNPRSYYKCTSVGCCVRKHVERASHDLKCVITTYEGKHNHQVPAARSSGSSGGGSHVGPSGAEGGSVESGSSSQTGNVPLLAPLCKCSDFGKSLKLRAPPACQVAMQSAMGYGPLGTDLGPSLFQAFLPPAFLSNMSPYIEQHENPLPFLHPVTTLPPVMRGFT